MNGHEDIPDNLIKNSKLQNSTYSVTPYLYKKQNNILYISIHILKQVYNLVI